MFRPTLQQPSERRAALFEQAYVIYDRFHAVRLASQYCAVASQTVQTVQVERENNSYMQLFDVLWRFTTSKRS
jgi:cell division protein FtsB